MSNTKENPEYVHDSVYNRKMIQLTEQYLALVKIQLKTKLKEMQDGARTIANNSKNPELKKVCDKLDTLEIV